MARTVLHFLLPNDDTENDCLSDGERTRADRFVFAEDSKRWRSYRSGLRRILGGHLMIEPRDVPLAEGANGKPELTRPHDRFHFNLSHADDLAAVLVSDTAPVGIDLEPWSRADSLIECADSFCHPLELEALPDNRDERARRLLEIWTSKESLLKALGTGLTYPPQSLRIDGDHGIADQSLDGVEDFRIIVPSHPAQSHHRIALAVNRNDTEVHIEDRLDW